MNTSNRTVLVIAFVIVVLLFLVLSGGAMAGVSLGSGMMAGGMMGGISWMWIPAVIFLGLGIFLGWAIFGKK
jgi:heme/copper-type cytochrome/quinol oxidase subunit 2